MINEQAKFAPLSAEDRKLIGELRDLATTLDRQGVLATMAGNGGLLPSDVLERSPEARTACLAEARDLCRKRVRALEFARLRRRLATFILPFAFGATATVAMAIAGKPYVLHLLG